MMTPNVKASKIVTPTKKVPSEPKKTKKVVQDLVDNTFEMENTIKSVKAVEKIENMKPIEITPLSANTSPKTREALKSYSPSKAPQSKTTPEVELNLTEIEKMASKARDILKNIQLVEESKKEE